MRLVFAPEQEIAVVRRRRGQLRVPALQPRRLPSSAPTRTASRRKSPHCFKWSADGAEGGRPGVRHRPPRHDQPAGNARQAEAPPRRDAAVHAGPAAGDGGGAASSSASAARRTAGRRRPTCTASPTPARRSAGQYQGLLDPEILDTKAEHETKLHAPSRDDPRLRRQRSRAYDAAVEQIADVQKVYATFEKPYNLLETRRRLLVASCSPSPGTSSG